MAGAEGPEAEDRGWEPPAEIDGFRVVRQLARGGMGTVYLGHDDVLERPVAIKVLAVGDPEVNARDRFLVEARAIARLQHPNVVGIYRVGEVLGRPYLAYEFIPGRSLDQLPKPIPWARALELVIGVARGLAAAHRRDVLHRDIKPANVVLADSGEVKLLDFGLAKLLDGRVPLDDVAAVPPERGGRGGRGAALEDSEAAPENAPTRPVTCRPDTRGSGAHGAGSEDMLTAAGAVMGTPLYMAPELWRGEPASVQSDVYALGLLLYELLTGQNPHQGLRETEIAEAVQLRDPAPLRSLCPTVPQALADVVDRAIRRRRADRPQSAQEMLDSLEAIHSLYEPFSTVPGASPEGDDARLISTSFARIAPRADEFCARMYERLFTAHPELRPLFPPDLAAQRRKLFGALVAVVDNLQHPDRLVPLLEDLGRRHAAYGVPPESFDAVGAALLGAIGDFDAELQDLTRAAWARAYAKIAHAMQRGLASEPPDTSPRGNLTSSASDAAVPTRYALNGDVSLAYQVIGAGPVDLVLATGWLTHLEAGWQWPPLARFLRSLAGLGRLIVFDARGTGLSDASAGADARLGNRAADLGAVLDAAGAARAVVIGLGEGAAPALLFAAAHPDRTRALILYGANARSTAGDGHPHGPSPEAQEAAAARIRSAWGEPLFLERLAPSLVGDAAFREFWARYLRAAAGPGAALAHHRANADLDVRAMLPAVRAPALVLHREGDAAVPIAAGRDVALRLANAQFVALAGGDHLPFVGDSAALIEVVRRFLARIPAPPAVK